MIDVQAVKADLKNIEFKCSDQYLEEALYQAAATPTGLERLLRQLEWMNNGQFFGHPVRCLLFSDSWPGSVARNFYWEIRPPGGDKFYMNGGLIHHGDGDWSIHT